MRAFIDEGRSGAIQIGQTAWVRLRSDPQTLVEAEVVRIDQENDRITEERRIYVRCRACKPEHQIRYLGEQAEVEVVTGIATRAIFVPARLVEAFDGKRGLVWTIEDGRLMRRNIEFGNRLIDGRLEILSGVPNGTHVIISDMQGAREGRASRIVNRSADK